MQGVLIFIQLLLAEGQEQNSDLTEVYIIFIQKSTFFIYPRVFPKLRSKFAGSPGSVRFLTFNKTQSRELLLANANGITIAQFSQNSRLTGSPGNAGDRTPHRLVNGDFLFVLAERFNNAYFPRIGVSPFTFFRSWAQPGLALSKRKVVKWKDVRA